MSGIHSVSVLTLCRDGRALLVSNATVVCVIVVGFCYSRCCRMAITALIDAAFGLPVVEVPVVAESPFLEIHLVAVVGRGP